MTDLNAQTAPLVVCKIADELFEQAPAFGATRHVFAFEIMVRALAVMTKQPPDDLRNACIAFVCQISQRTPPSAFTQDNLPPSRTP